MIPTLLYSICGGMLGVLATGRFDHIAWRFLRTAGLVAFGLACAAVLWTVTRAEMPASLGTWAVRCGGSTAGAAVGVVFLAPAAQRLPGLYRGLCLAGGSAGIAAGAVSLLALVPAMGSPSARTMVLASQVLGCALLGSITVAWLLGHAYLTATKMTIAPLRHFSRLVSWSVAARLAFTGLSVGIAWLGWAGAPPTVAAKLEASWLIVLLRVLVGLVAVAVFAYMVADCVRLRSTQSATGILYFGSLCVIIGELAAVQLVIECGWPV